MTEREQRIADHRRSQPEDELRRKAKKSVCRSYWTQEELDYADSKARRWSALFNGEITP